MIDVWRKMTPEEYAAQYKGFGTHKAISLSVAPDVQEVRVYLGDISWRKIIGEDRDSQR